MIIKKISKINEELHTKIGKINKKPIFINESLEKIEEFQINDETSNVLKQTPKEVIRLSDGRTLEKDRPNRCILHRHC
jgi:hypothetical protein